MKAYTDYPIEELGDSPYMMTLIRECELLECSNDQCLIQIENVEKVIDRKYVYPDRHCSNPIVQGDVFH